MEFTKRSCEEFVEVLASSAPVPGGGGAAALVGAVGTALGNMVGSLTVGKKKYADVEEEMTALEAPFGQGVGAGYTLGAGIRAGGEQWYLDFKDSLGK